MKNTKKMIIPKEFYLFGQKIDITWDIKLWESSQDDSLHICSYRNNTIKIAPNTGPFECIPKSRVEGAFIEAMLSQIIEQANIKQKLQPKDIITASRLLHQAIVSAKLMDGNGFKIPKKINLFSHEIKVRWDNKLTEEGDCRGIAIYNQNIISLLPSKGPYENIPIEKVEETFLHEVIHFVLWYTNGHEDITEEEVVIIAHLLHQAIKTSKGDLYQDIKKVALT